MNTPTIFQGDCLEVMALLPDSSIDAIVTDPPYGLGFMGKAWDDLPPGLPWAQECLRVLKPGGHLLAFGSTRTWHRLACAIEDSGFEMRDSIAWLYGSGFPKSRNVGREVEGFEGWGTALKPAFEPIVVARKPLVGTVAANVLTHGTGALNIAATRIGDGAESQGARPLTEASAATRYTDAGSVNLAATPGPRGGSPAGRWPANVVLDEDQAAALDQQSGNVGGSLRGDDGNKPARAAMAGGSMAGRAGGHADKGGASRFFYVAKAPKSERPVVDGVAHPTVKPLALMRWLVRLVTPPGGLVLDPFAGSGTTVEAAMLEGFSVVGIERDPEYAPLIHARIERAGRTLATPTDPKDNA